MNNAKCCQNIPVWKILGVILTIWLVVFISVLTWNEIKKHDYIGRESQQTYTISVDGEGKVTSVPDIAQISLGLETQKATVAEAQKENTEKMNKIIAQLKSMGIEEKDIQTTNYNIYPQYDYTNGRQTLRGYSISQSVNVKIRNLDNVGQIVEKAGSLGANQVGGLNFTIDDPEKVKQEAREIALVKAKEKAESLAKIAGVKLGKLVSFTESYSQPGSVVYRDSVLKVEGYGMGGDVAVPAPDLQVGSQDVIVNVVVTYEVL